MPNQSKTPNRQSKIPLRNPVQPLARSPKQAAAGPRFGSDGAQNHQIPRVSLEDREFRELREDCIDRAALRPPSSCTQPHPRDRQSKIQNRQSIICSAAPSGPSRGAQNEPRRHPLTPDSYPLNPKKPRVSHEDSIGAIESIDAIDRAATRPSSSSTQPHPCPDCTIHHSPFTIHPSPFTIHHSSTPLIASPRPAQLRPSSFFAALS
jgi:hypothetical protein